MPRLSFRNLTAWLCLICFGLNATLLSGGMVLCSDRGGSRLELGCVRDAKGCCVNSCCTSDSSDEEHPAQPSPCQDTPIQDAHQIAKVAASRTVVDFAPLIPIAEVILQSALQIVAPPIGTRATVGVDRPPDAVARLRTVVLLV